ncbi:acyl-CoA dehydratase activase [Acetobacterium wieringae]|uniref:Acyl-CoA dehydratase activase n=1 Tax=Acetobacterium wieringae TaxID=52694 RepID=A0ABY6HHD9_9FIRM|nr:acyl-CoA dehydratase activase [Acetobacterium wieringae]UYO63953.1 acyl-CoA dehydratase activase [Acetobacterium wieringae]
MILGIDIGTGVTKGALLKNGEFIWGSKTDTEANPTKAVEKIFENLNNEKNIQEKDLSDVVLTGWGQSKVSGRKSNELVNSISRGALWANPTVKSVLSMGSQESIVIKINDNGKVTGYARNDKCASGAGKFLEIICNALECSVAELSEIASRSTKKIRISNQCAVFTESEVVSLVNDGEKVEDIVSAILSSLTVNIASLCKKTVKKDALMVGGGMANNEKICALLQNALGVEICTFKPEVDYIAAIGAAVSVNGGIQ